MIHITPGDQAVDYEVLESHATVAGSSSYSYTNSIGTLTLHPEFKGLALARVVSTSSEQGPAAYFNFCSAVVGGSYSSIPRTSL